MKQYHDLLKTILKDGVKHEDRTGVGTLSIFGYQMRFDLREGFPLVTSKKTFFRGVVEEFLWMIVRGSIDVKELQDKNIQFWNEWMLEDGTIGKGYGRQFRNFNGEKLDQISEVINNIKNNKYSRRHIITNWNPLEIKEMSLPCCHGNIIQFDVNNNQLSCQVYGRSSDTILGLPMNIAFYAILLIVIAQQCDLQESELIYTIGNAHIYLNHLEQTSKILKRELYPLPKILINKKDSINDYIYEDFQLLNYKYHPKIEAKVAV